MPSGFSVLEYTGDGTTDTFAVNFTLGYLKKSDIYCRVGEEVDGSNNPVYRELEDIPGDPGRMRVLGTVPTVGESVLFRRITSKTELQNDFTDGTSLDDDALNTSFLQTLMIAHELLDGFGLGTVYADIDLTGHTIRNISTDETDPTSVASIGAMITARDAALAVQTAAELAQAAAEAAETLALADRIAAAASALAAANNATAAHNSELAASGFADDAGASATAASAGASVITTNLTAIQNITTNLTAVQGAAANASTASAKASEASASAASASSSAASASSSAASAAASAASSAAIVNPSSYARSIGGNAYKNILGIVCPPSLEVQAWDTQGANDGVPAGFTFSRATTATAFGPDGQLYTAEAGELRHEWDALTGEYRGWLLEGQATNLLLYSQDFTNAAWIKGNGCVATSPTRLTWGGPSSCAYEVVTVAADTKEYCWSLRVKKSSTSRKVNLKTFVGGSSVQNLMLDPATGLLLGSTTATNYGVRDCGDHWLVWVVRPNDGAQTTLYYQVFPDENNTGAYVDIIGGCQLEVGTYPTSYIPTTSAQVTRAADSLSIATSAFPFNALEGTLYAEASEYSNTNAGYPFIASLDGGSTNYQIGLFAIPSSAQINGQVFDGALMAKISTASPSVGAFGRHAMAWKVNDFAACGNGGTVGTDTLGTVPAVTTLQIGAVSTGAEAWFGHIRHIAYFPRRLSNTELQLLTK